MKTTITIITDDKDSLLVALSAVRAAVKKQPAMDDTMDEAVQFSDHNCFGEYSITIVPEEE